MKIALEFNGTPREFSRALCEMDDCFEFLDSLIWVIDYDGDEATNCHSTKYGDIKIRKEIK